jgi:hypothetical protein
MKTLFLLFSSSIICMSQSPQASPIQQAAAAVSGSLKGEDGTLLGNGLVVLHLLPPYPPTRSLRTDFAAKTAAGGDFQLTSLPFGTYQICAQAASGTWLAPCEWESTRRTVTVSTLQPIANVTVTLKKGLAVPVRIDDVGGFLGQFEGKVPRAHLLLGVRNTVAGFRQATLISQDATGRNYQVIVPFGTSVNMHLFSTFFKLADPSGVALASNYGLVPIQVPAGQQPPAIRFKIVGGQ